MEVHAHSHTERKKWTHYFWEFLMLFLAVFCGFVAENEREHLVEHRREKQYMLSMIEDIRADTAHLSFIINDFKRISLAIDTLNKEFSILKKGFSASVYRNMPLLLGYEDFIPNDRTLQQLKNAGGMRLIRKENVSDSIMHYDKKVKDLLIEQASIWDMVIGKFRNLGEIIDAEIWKGDDARNIEQYSRENRDMLFSYDKKIVGKYNLWIVLYQGIVYGYLSSLKDAYAYAERLIRFIQREYHIK
jgi:hypothetical protein